MLGSLLVLLAVLCLVSVEAQYMGPMGMGSMGMRLMGMGGMGSGMGGMHSSMGYGRRPGMMAYGPRPAMGMGDAKLFTVEQAHNRKNDKIWSTEAPSTSAIVEHRQNPKSAMVWGGIIPLVFMDEGVKIEKDVHQRDILDQEDQVRRHRTDLDEKTPPLHAVYDFGEELLLGTRGSRGVGGVGVLVNTVLAMNIDSYQSLTSRIGRLRLKRCGSVAALTVFVAYAPTSDYDDEEVEALYVELEKFH
ncbi:unnamed protein product [Heligmosomoides polygyrus]|uniref:Secreted protein n=1 Tax=Heligmosomoides polygyrus TaxID=6339 RepID=A0A3P8ACQ6_HELPZ|nr:unnamed protein product [Heligmosomoides polygyrus]